MPDDNYRCLMHELGEKGYMAHVRDVIEKHGWMVQWVFDVNPPFGYSIGLVRFQLPEIMVTAVPGELAASLINVVGRRMRQFVADGETDKVFHDWSRANNIIRNHDVVFRELTMDAIDKNCTMLLNLFPPKYVRSRVLHMVLPDRDGLFPWEPGCRLGLQMAREMEYLSS